MKMDNFGWKGTRGWREDCLELAAMTACWYKTDTVFITIIIKKNPVIAGPQAAGERSADFCG
jgi:hypothetical protein